MESEPKRIETYSSSELVDSDEIWNSPRQIQHGSFADKDEEELAAQGKKQQTRVRERHERKPEKNMD